MFTIAKRFELSASHVLEGLPEGHQCGRMHGHNYVIEIEMKASSLNEHGFVFDYGDLKPIKDWIDREVDHRHLNDLVDFQPSAEHLATWVYDKARMLIGDRPTDAQWYISAVRIHETPKTVAEYRP